MLSVINIKKTEAKYFEKASIKIKTKKPLILRIHDVVEPLPNFVARPANRLSGPSVCELEQLSGGILKIFLKKERCILYIYRVKPAKNDKVLIPEDFHTASK